MPRYELCYILSAQVSDDQVPGVSEDIKNIVNGFGATELEEQHLGKKKLAYPIKKTRNGYYVALRFLLDSKTINKLDAKIRAQTNTIIRYIIVNLDEHLKRSEKDKIAQASLPKRTEGENGVIADKEPETISPESQKESEPAKKEEAPAKDLSEADLDKKIEDALTESLK